MMNLQRVEFVKSAAQAGAFLHDGLPQIAFAGKSNVGKSSVLNCVLQRKNFARVGQKPGKTVHINYFRVDGKAHFVDLPGYGYAQVAESEKERWGKLMERILPSRSHRPRVMIVDARHAPTKLDCVMADLFRSTGRPFLVVANKLDKLKHARSSRTLPASAKRCVWASRHRCCRSPQRRGPAARPLCAPYLTRSAKDCGLPFS